MRLALCALLAATASPAHAAVDMVSIPAGRFVMGASAEDAARDKAIPPIAAAERPTHEVSVRAFRLARHPVTRAEFARFVAATGPEAPGCHVWTGLKWTDSATAGWRDPGFPQADRDPVVCVSRDDALAYAAWRSKLDGRRYRLPSEAEWEYASRAGAPGSRPWARDLAAQCARANGAAREYLTPFPQEADVNRDCDDGHVHTAPVDALPPNPWGLADMLGNAWEWTADCAHDDYANAPADGSAWTEPGCKTGVFRGGAWFDGPWLLRHTTRNGGPATYRFNGTGFRLAE